jgi:hypothetical protein
MAGFAVVSGYSSDPGTGELKDMPATRTRISGIAAIAAASLAVNTTGLPSYPHVKSAIMDDVPRSTLGRQCTHYAADSPDPLETVEAWYRKAFPGAVESDVNEQSLYGSYFKLTGIRLSRDNDFLTVYRMPGGTSTSIELFKCGATPK